MGGHGRMSGGTCMRAWESKALEPPRRASGPPAPCFVPLGRRQGGETRADRANKKDGREALLAPPPACQCVGSRPNPQGFMTPPSTARKAGSEPKAASHRRRMPVPAGAEEPSGDPRPRRQSRSRARRPCIQLHLLDRSSNSSWHPSGSSLVQQVRANTVTRVRERRRRRGYTSCPGTEQCPCQGDDVC
jgi:hypothetical protein